MAVRYSISQGDEFGLTFSRTLSEFQDEQKTLTSPASTLYDTISDRSSSPYSTAGTAVEDVGFSGWTFNKPNVDQDSDESDSDDESDDEDVPQMDLGCDKLEETNGNEDAAYSDAEDGEEITFSQPFAAASFRHTSVPPPISPRTRQHSPALPFLPEEPVHYPSRSQAHLPILAPDDDAEHLSDHAPSDDEYCPSPPLNPKKRASSNMSRPNRRPSKKQRLSPSAATIHPPVPSPSRRPRAPPPSRNKQAAVRDIAELVDSDDFKCPICPWVQENRRKPDFNRHLQTHVRGEHTDQSIGWWCKGVRLEDLDKFNGYARMAGRKMISPGADHKVFRDHWRIGGCLLNFSRRDALKRHLDNPSMPCSGYACKAMEEC